MASAAGRGRAGTVPGRITDAQRGRILQAMAEVTAERGFAGASTELVRARARVSRRTFEGLFSSREECLAAVFDLGRKRTAELVMEAFAGAESWQQALRTMLASLLVMLDSEPVLARVWLVESLAAGPWALEYRERSIRGLQNLIVSRWPAAEGWREPPLAAEGLIASVLGIMHAHIVMGRPEPLIELLGPLMGQIGRAYLPGARPSGRSSSEPNWRAGSRPGRPAPCPGIATWICATCIARQLSIRPRRTMPRARA